MSTPSKRFMKFGCPFSHEYFSYEYAWQSDYLRCSWKFRHPFSKVWFAKVVQPSSTVVQESTTTHRSAWVYNNPKCIQYVRGLRLIISYTQYVRQCWLSEHQARLIAYSLNESIITGKVWSMQALIYPCITWFRMYLPSTIASHTNDCLIAQWARWAHTYKIKYVLLIKRFQSYWTKMTTILHASYTILNCRIKWNWICWMHT